MTTSALLLRMPNWLGDCVMALPVLQVLREQRHELDIIIAARKHLLPLFAEHPAVSRTLEAPASGGAGFLTSLMSARLGPVPDTGILLTNSISTAVWLWRCGCRERIGFARDGRSFLLTKALDVTPALAAAHMREYYLALLAALEPAVTLPSAPVQPKLCVPKEGDGELDRLLNQMGLRGRPYAVLAPVSAYGSVKDWPPGCFAAIAAKIVGDLNLPVLIAGTRDQAAASEALARQAGSGVESVAGRTGVAGFLALTSRASLFVGNDSGGAHVAAAANVPTVVIFGITEPSRTRPLGVRVRIVGQGGERTPDLRNPETRRRAREALEAITVDQVWKDILQVWREAAHV